MASRENEKHDSSDVTIRSIDPGLAPELFRKVKESTASQLKVHLGIPEGGTLPRELTRMTEDRIKNTFSKNLAEIVDTDIQSQVKATLKKPAFVVFDEQIRTSLSSTEHFQNMEELNSILRSKLTSCLPNDVHISTLDFLQLKQCKLYLQK